MPSKIKKISTDEVMVGMFIRDLDRPWQDTPFALEGFLVKQPEQIPKIRLYCEFVYVDLQRSVGAARQFLVASGAGPEAGPQGDARAFFSAGGELAQKPVLVLNGERVVSSRELVQAQGVQGRVRATLEKASQLVQSGQEVPAEEITQAVDQMMESINLAPDAMVWLVRLKSRHDYAYRHSIASAVYAIAFARLLGYPKADLRVIGMAALLKDLGNLQLPPALLAKQAPLTPMELAVLKGHVAHSVKIVRAIHGLPRTVANLVAQHHERYDGNGYPKGRKADAIDHRAALISLADAYSALTLPRPYAEACSSHDAISLLLQEAGKQFHPGLAGRFSQSIGIYPVGALVELSTGEVAIVVAQYRTQRLRPRLMVVLDASHQKLAPPMLLDLVREPCDPAGQPYRIRRELPSGCYGVDVREYYL